MSKRVVGDLCLAIPLGVIWYGELTVDVVLESEILHHLAVELNSIVGDYGVPYAESTTMCFQMNLTTCAPVIV